MEVKVVEAEFREFECVESIDVEFDIGCELHANTRLIDSIFFALQYDISLYF